MKSFKDFIAEDKLTLVDFYATWCAPCKVMHPILDEYKKQMSGDVRVLKLDVDAPANAPITKEFHVSSLPTLIFFRNGEIKWRESGVVSASQLKKTSDTL